MAGAETESPPGIAEASVGTAPHTGLMALRVADRVTAVDDIGLFRPRVPSGTSGTVAAVSRLGEVEVHFDNGRVELVRPDRVRTAAKLAG
jgi:hypothetical protein